MYIVYILISRKDITKCYIGITQDLEKRVKEHNSDKAGYTKRYAPWAIATFITFRDVTLAENFEKYLKSGSGLSFLKRHLI